MAGGKDSPAKGTSTLEWVAAGVGGLIIAAIVVYLLRDGLSGGSAPPLLTVERLSVVDAPSGHLVQIRVENQGDATAASLQVRGKLLDGERIVEESEAVVDYVPKRSSRDAGLHFQNDPDDFELVLTPGGYTVP